MGLRKSKYMIRNKILDMKAPLAIYVVYHTHNAKAHVIFSKIYKLFCRDIRNSLSDGLDIPVFFATEETHFNVDFDRAEKTFVQINKNKSR